MSRATTFDGVSRAAERLIADLLASTIDDHDAHESFRARVDSLTRRLDALWSNPADVDAAGKLKDRLRSAWAAANGDS